MTLLHINLFFQKAYPDDDLRYFSKLYALLFPENAQYHLITKGAFVEEKDELPILC
jgi:hypothetical protein